MSYEEKPVLGVKAVFEKTPCTNGLVKAYENQVAFPC